jgi:hypothetical protein
MDEIIVDDSLNLDSSGTFELGRKIVPAADQEPEAPAPDFPAARKRGDSRSELHSFVFDDEPAR